MIPHISSYVRITRRKPKRIFTEPLCESSVVPAVEVVLQAGRVVELFAGKGEEQVDGGVGFRH